MRRLGQLLLAGALCTQAVACGNGPGTGSAAPAPADDGTPVEELTAEEVASRLPDAIVGAGGALAGQPVHYFDADSATTGYLAVPRGAGPFPAVILIHEWAGLVDRVRHFADDLARQGYVVLAADLYSGHAGTTREENRALMDEARSDPQRIINNLDAAARFLRGRPDGTGRVATIGWCFGGGIALSYALGGETHEGTAMFYGRLITDPRQLITPDTISHEIYGTFAEMDRTIPPAEVERFVEALRQAGIENDIHIYDDVDHGFWLYVDQDPARRAPALDAWQRLKAYLARTIR
jgi:carboxymethylenebutenolidase